MTATIPRGKLLWPVFERRRTHFVGVTIPASNNALRFGSALSGCLPVRRRRCLERGIQESGVALHTAYSQHDNKEKTTEVLVVYADSALELFFGITIEQLERFTYFATVISKHLRRLYVGKDDGEFARNLRILIVFILATFILRIFFFFLVSSFFRVFPRLRAFAV